MGFNSRLNQQKEGLENKKISQQKLPIMKWKAKRRENMEEEFNNM